jgi:hypothetical protein
MARSILSLLLLTSTVFLAPPTPAWAEPSSDPPATTPPARVRAWQTGFMAPDRWQHASLALTLGLGAGAAGARPAVALVGASALGLAKELHDARRTRFDPIDLAADVCGAAVAAYLVRQYRR